MATKGHKPEKIVTKLRQVEVLVGQGMSRVDAIREVRITEQTYYRWRNPRRPDHSRPAAHRHIALQAGVYRRQTF